MRKIINIITVCLFYFLIIPFLNSCKSNNNPNTYALFIYMSGADLEEGSGAASKVINEILSFESNDNVQIYIQTGGSSRWDNQSISNDSVNLFKVSNRKLELLEDKGKCSMGDVTTFSSFISFTNGVDSDRKILMFWGHGSPYGLCYDATHQNDRLTYKEINEGLKDSYFDLIIFNACYTANLDLLTFISGNASYAIASEDVFPSSGYDYHAMLNLFASDDAKEVKTVAKEIVDTTIKKYSNSTLKNKITISVIDLVRLSVIKEYFIEYFNDVLYESKSWLKGANLANSIGSIGKDFYDINEHINANETLFNMLNKFVLYEYHGDRFDANGLYLYYKEDFTGYDMTLYEKNCAYSNYYTIITHKEQMSNEKYINFIPSIFDNNYVCNATTDETAVYYLSNIYYEFYDEEGLSIKEDIIGLNCLFNDINNYSYINVTSQSLFNLSFGGYNLNYQIESVQEEGTKIRIIYSTEASLNSTIGKIYFSYTYDDTSDNDGDYEIIGFSMLNSQDEEFSIIVFYNRN